MNYSPLGYSVVISCPICGHTGEGVWYPLDNDGDWEECCDCGANRYVKHSEYYDAIQELLFNAWENR